MPLDVKWPFPPGKELPAWWTFRSKLTIAAVGLTSKIWAEWLNRTRVHNREVLFDALENRPVGQSLVTVSNHHSCVDDPMLWGMLKWVHLVSRNQVYLRWVSSASDISFTKEWHSKFFSLGRCVPVCRGDGVYQKGMDCLLQKLNNGEWVHMFPEGKVNMKKDFMRLKWGVGRLIADCAHLPIVVPFYHLGMDNVLPNESPYIPRIGKRVSVLIGEPIDFKQQLKSLREARKSPMEIRKQLTDRIQEELLILKEKTELLHNDDINR